jgi:hypothetical protein
MGVKISQDLIETKVKDIFPNYIFDFSDYKNTHSKIQVICDKKHQGQQIVKNILKGHGCNICGNLENANKQRRNINDVIDNFKKVHGDKYDYSLFNYIRNRVPSTIICSKHGDFQQDASSHLKGSGCPKCSNNKRLTNKEFIDYVSKIHSKEYNYDEVDYKSMHKKVKIKCPEHGFFEQTPYSHRNGSGCPKCNQSKGENLIEIFLIKNKIKYIVQKKFEGCKNINYLLFDFYLPDFNTCIEFNGIQHYYPIDLFGGNNGFELTKKRDLIKIDYCNTNDIRLVVIKQDKKHINISDVNRQIYDILSEFIIKESSYIITEYKRFEL